MCIASETDRESAMDIAYQYFPQVTAILKPINAVVVVVFRRTAIVVIINLKLHIIEELALHSRVEEYIVLGSGYI
jgi:hypothetical protein